MNKEKIDALTDASLKGLVATLTLKTDTDAPDETVAAVTGDQPLSVSDASSILEGAGYRLGFMATKL